MTEVIEKTENKKGYKKTKLGWIPEEWEIIKFKDIGVSLIGLTYSPKDIVSSGLLVLRSSNIKDSKIVYDDNVYVNKDVPKKLLTKQNDILMCVRNGSKNLVGKSALIKKENEGHTFGAFMSILRSEYNKYLYQFLQSSYAQKQYTGATSATINQITSKDLDLLLLTFPKIKEQEQIVEILSVWDEGIETLEKLIEQKEVSKKAIMQKLFLEKESWKMIRFDKIFKDFCKKNCPEERLLSATQENGVIPRDMLSGKVMSPEGSLEGYKLIEAGDFVISLRSFQGGLEYSKYRGILSPAYTVLKNIINIDKDFYRHFFKSYKFIEKYLSISVIGIRDGKQISYSDLSSVKIPYPPLEEQEKIGKILNCYDEEIQILNSKLEKLKEQKKGLMQKLLTGQIRVKV